MDKQYSALFEPFMINQLKIKNRFFMAPMGIPVIAENGGYTKEAIEYYAARAKGGVGLIIAGANWVRSNPEKLGKPNLPTPAMNPEAYKNAGIEMTDRIHAYGCKIFVQLAAGLECSATKNPWELSKDEVQEIVTAFAEAAKIVQASGFDGVEVHGGHLLDAFTMALFNHGTDQDGVDLIGRLGIVTEILQAIKAACGKDFPVLLGFSMKSYIKALGQEALPGEAFNEVGRDLDEALEAAKILEQAGYDGFNVTAGTGDSSYWVHPTVYFEKGVYLHLSESLKNAVQVPVLAAGRMDDPDLAAAALAEGKLDAVGLGRPLLADPDYPNKLKSGSIKDIRPCLGCHDGCISRKLVGGRASCAVNPECNRELLVRLESAKESKCVVVVGGGPAGLEAARVSAARGNQVTLFEATNGLGGMLKYSSERIFKNDDHRLIAWYEQQLHQLKVDVRLNTKGTKEKIAAIKPDIVYIAQGSTAIELEFPGRGSEKVTNAIDVFTGKSYVGPRCTVIGGGIAGCEVALHLAKHRHKMTIVEAAADILKAGIPLAPPNERMLRDLLAFYHVEIVTSARLKAVTETGALIVTDGQERDIPAHHVIIAVGYESTASLYQEIKNDYPHVYNLGDSQKTRNIRAAIWDGYEVARSI